MAKVTNERKNRRLVLAGLPRQFSKLPQKYKPVVITSTSCPEEVQEEKPRLGLLGKIVKIFRG